MSKIVKTDKNKFLFVLCLFNPSVRNVLDYIWVGNPWDRNMSGCVPDGKEALWPYDFALFKPPQNMTYDS